MRSNTKTSPEKVPQRLADTPVPVRLKMSALWVSTMFLYVYVDILGFYKPGMIADILVGRVWEFEISQAWALGAMVLLTVPSLMIFLSLALPARQARWTNIVAASVYIPVSIFNLIGDSWSYMYFGAAVETALLALVIWYAWTWPRLSTEAPHSSRRDHGVVSTESVSVTGEGGT